MGIFSRERILRFGILAEQVEIVEIVIARAKSFQRERPQDRFRVEGYCYPDNFVQAHSFRPFDCVVIDLDLETFGWKGWQAAERVIRSYRSSDTVSLLFGHKRLIGAMGNCYLNRPVVWDDIWDAYLLNKKAPDLTHLGAITILQGWKYA